MEIYFHIPSGSWTEPKFKVGQKVTLAYMPSIEGIAHMLNLGVKAPYFRQIVTVRAVTSEPTGYGIVFEEIVNNTVEYQGINMEPTFTENGYLDATNLEDSRLFSEKLISELEQDFKLPPGTPSEHKGALISHIVSRIKFLRPMTDEELARTICKLLDMEYYELELLDAAYEVQCERKTGK